MHTVALPPRGTNLNAPIQAATEMPPGYLFIDGGYLRDKYKAFAHWWYGHEGELDFDRLHSDADAPPKTFYYDCRDRRKRTETEVERDARRAKEEAFYNRIQAIPGMHFRAGRLVGTMEKSRQKGVDVKLAVDMLQFATRGSMTHATLLAGDADFVPLVRALVNIGTDVTVWGEPRTVAPTLRHAADRFKPILVRDLHRWTDPYVEHVPFVDVSGREVSTLERSRLGYSGWVHYAMGKVGEHRADLWCHGTGGMYSLAVETEERGTAFIHRVSHSDLRMLRRYAKRQWKKVELRRVRAR